MVRETYFYDVLSISQNATTEEVSRAYKKLALKCHPDKTNHDPQLTEKFKEMTRAYEILKDSKQRHIYDKYGKEGLERLVLVSETPDPNPAQRYRQNRNHSSSQGSDDSFEDSDEDFAHFNNQFPQFFTATSRSARSNPFGHLNPLRGHDIFSQVFDDINSMFSNQNAFFSSHSSLSTNMGSNSFYQLQLQLQLQPMKKIVKPYGEPIQNQFYRGENIYHQCDVSLNDLMYGKTIKLSLPKNMKCVHCDGHGGYNPCVCPTCLGSGKVMVIHYNQFSQQRQTGTCEKCQGTGVYVKPSDKCIYCESGYVETTKIIKIHIPPGARQSDKIVIKGEGDEGRNVIPGDLIVEIRQKPHPYLTRKRNDLFMDYNIDLKTALLGGEILIPNFLRVGQFLKIYINSHGNSSINNEKVQQGEVLGTINLGEPKLVKNLGMPINTDIIANNGILIQTSTNEENEEKQRTDKFRQFNRGNLYINFHVQLPSIEEFSQQALINLENALPSNSSYIASPTEKIIETHLSNLPGTKSHPINIDQTPSSSSSPNKDESNDKMNYGGVKWNSGGNSNSSGGASGASGASGTSSANSDSARTRNNYFDISAGDNGGNGNGAGAQKRRKFDGSNTTMDGIQNAI